MIPVSDLRKGNLIKTEHGILPVHSIVFNAVQVKGTDGRILWANQVEGVELSDEILKGFGIEVEYTNGGWLRWRKGNFKLLDRKLPHPIDHMNYILLAHELQNLYYWIERKELEFKTDSIE